MIAVCVWDPILDLRHPGTLGNSTARNRPFGTINTTNVVLIPPSVQFLSPRAAAAPIQNCARHRIVQVGSEWVERITVRTGNPFPKITVPSHSRRQDAPPRRRDGLKRIRCLPVTPPLPLTTGRSLSNPSLLPCPQLPTLQPPPGSAHPWASTDFVLVADQRHSSSGLTSGSGRVLMA